MARARAHTDCYMGTRNAMYLPWEVIIGNNNNNRKMLQW